MLNIPLERSFRDLFRPATTSDVLAMFQSLLESRDILPGEALALTGAVHAGLRKPCAQDGAVYAGYARAMALLRYALPEIHGHAAANWRLN